MFTISSSVNSGIIHIYNTPSSPHWDKNSQFKFTISIEQLINIDKNNWQQSEPPVPNLSSSDSELIPVLQKYSNIRLNKQSMINILNSSKGFLQSDCSTTETDLFRIYINIDFPFFDTNMDTSRLRSVLKTTKIFRLE